MSGYSEVELLGGFAGAMAERLAANSYKRGWRELTPRQLLARLKQEVGELEGAMRGVPDPIVVTREAADVANFAAMIADAYRVKGD